MHVQSLRDCTHKKMTPLLSWAFVKQHGQAMVLVLAFLSLLMVSMLMLFNTGKLTHDKMELQNAADAVVYSAAVLEARHLNFVAYTNRAMIANEIALGQTIGLATWLMKWGGTFISLGNILNMVLAPIPFVGPFIAAAVKAGLNAIGKIFAKFSEIVGKFAAMYSKLVAGLNTFYGYSQMAFRFGTYETILRYSDDIAEKNAPGARLGTMAEFMQFVNLLAFHLYEENCKPTDARSKTTKPKEHKAQTECMQKMAAAVNDSRDLWTADRHNDMLGMSLEKYKNIPLLGKFGVALDLGIFGEGGSTLRYISGGKSEPDKHKGHFNWSSMDTNEFKFGLSVWLFGVKIPLYIPMPLGWGTMQLAHQDKATKKVYGLSPGAWPALSMNCCNMVGEANWLSYYGKSWQENLATSAMASLGFDFYPWGVGITTQGGLKNDYGDLAPFMTINKTMGTAQKFLGIQMPVPYVVWVYKETKDIHTSDNLSSGSPTGDLALKTNAAGDSTLVPKIIREGPGLQAIATGEVYYQRSDGKGELPNAFSPYWQARLGKTDNVTLILAMSAQSPELAWAFTGIPQSPDPLDDFKKQIMDELVNTGDLVNQAKEEALYMIDPTGTLNNFIP